MKDKIRLGVIGLGCRGTGLLNLVIFNQKDVDVTAVCDSYEDRIEKTKKEAAKRHRVIPAGFTDYNKLIKETELDAVIISSGWQSHVEIASACMEAGIPVAMEVGGAHSLQECFKLCEVYEKTKTPFMFLENCCYGENELAVLNAVRQGVFGEVVHCSGGYKHDLRYEISFGRANKHYRLDEYINNNCENYPTHEIGPIAKILGINYGNRFVSLVSVSSCAKGLHRYILDRADKHKELEELKDVKFSQGDIVNTVIKCANGETVSIELDTSLPRHYSRGFSVLGTKARFEEDGDIFINDNVRNFTKNAEPSWGFKYKGKVLRKKYAHPIWKWFRKHGITGGHGGMDYLVLRAFFEAVKKGDGCMPIDVYDAATWMCISVLSEMSIKQGSIPVEFPDFTGGKWKDRKHEGSGMFFPEQGSGMK